MSLNYKTIWEHVGRVHEINWKKYADTYEPQKQRHTNLKYTERMNLPKLEENECVGISWYNRVKYQCNLCEHKTIGNRKINVHMKTSHGKKSKGNYIALTRDVYSCKLCGRMMTLNHTRIWEHVNIVHKMKWIKYEEKYETVTNQKKTLRLTRKEKGDEKLTPPPTHSSTPPPPPSYLCPLPSCSFTLPKPDMKAGGGARHLVDDHSFTVKDVGAGKIKWEKLTNILKLK